MAEATREDPEHVYDVWDATTRWIHWITVVLVFVMALSGFLIMFRKDLEIHSAEAKLALKALHASIGYVLLATLATRIVRGFVGSPHTRWRAVLPNRASLAALRPELRALIERRPHRYLGHAPASRVSATLMLGLLVVSVSSGLVRAGTDLFHPPIGYAVAPYLAKPGVDPGSLSPLDAGDIVKARQDRLNGFKIPFGRIHLYSCYALLALIALHIAGVALSETRQRSGLISAMFSGTKTFTEEPIDLEEFSRDPESS